VTPKLTKDDWSTLLVAIILAAILPGWVVLLVPIVPIVVIVLIGGLFPGR
jgi:hypothetical protein